ncbi:hypothetical protein FF1_021740 [Malus domestica]
MVKVRMNTVDVAAEIKCLRRLIGMRCSNVYDLSPKQWSHRVRRGRGKREAQSMREREGWSRSPASSESFSDSKIRDSTHERAHRSSVECSVDNGVVFNFSKQLGNIRNSNYGQLFRFLAMLWVFSAHAPQSFV